MFEFNVEYSENEIKLLSQFSSCKNIIGRIMPVVIYRMAVEESFLKNLNGPHIEALRRGFNAIIYCTHSRMTKEFEDLISF